MSRIRWDKVGERDFESGLDRGVLYLPDGSGVPWNGLTALIEKFDKDASPVYFDGRKIQDLVVLGDFAATMKAITYPEEFAYLEGQGELRPGIYVNDQEPKTFGLTYRTMFGDDLSGMEAGYKIHILWNVTATAKEKTYATASNDPNLVEFEWELVAVPEEVEGFRPTAHFIINSKEVDPWLLEDIETKLYGTSGANASLLPMDELVSFMASWYRVKITDNGDGTWKAESQRPGFIFFLDGATESEFLLKGVNAVYVDDETYVLSDTIDISDVPQIKIEVFDDGSWSATTESDELIDVNPDGTFTIFDANVVFIDADTYQLQDTTI
jgi:hypothetical protein